ncbi:hypothetical protein PCAR4_450014 [Paraburkholderia caribensis]|nr:hypothetical protein PCAR4_450014 [Paraburkholderia caribensis]
MTRCDRIASNYSNTIKRPTGVWIAAHPHGTRPVGCGSRGARSGGGSIEVEHIEQRFLLAARIVVLAMIAVVGIVASAPLLFVTAIAVAVARVALDLIASVVRFGRVLHLGQQLVQFAAIEPYATARRAIVDLDALTFGHQQIGGLANGALHCVAPFVTFIPLCCRSGRR